MVLDEPNSNLDGEGSEALMNAIRQLKADGRIVVIMAHRPAAIAECDLLLVVDDGAVQAFGPRDEVLREQVRNHATIALHPQQAAAAVPAAAQRPDADVEARPEAGCGGQEMTTPEKPTAARSRSWQSPPGRSPRRRRRGASTGASAPSSSSATRRWRCSSSASAAGA